MTARKKKLLKWFALLTFGVPLLGALGLWLVVSWCEYPIEELDPDRNAPLLFTDRHGEILRSVPAADGRRFRWVPLEDIPSIAAVTFLVSEDREFFDHGGVDPKGFARAAWLNLAEGRIGYGGSTITMQLVRMIHSPGRPRTIWNKLRESVLALRLEKRVDKRTILEQYLNRAPFGNGTVGIEAAAERYFGKSASALSVSEATFLAVLPRAPTAYNPLKGTDKALRRRQHVFGLLSQHGLASAEQIHEASAQRLVIEDHPPPFVATHFVNWVYSELPADVRARGGLIRTSLDLRLQKRLEAIASDHVQALAGRGVEAASVVVLDSQTSEVLAQVSHAGAAYAGLNMATWRRHPGSALKPFVYALAIESGDNPSTIAYDIIDVPSKYQVTPGTAEAGPLPYRDALAGSYNLAAVHVLERLGVEPMITFLKSAGLGPLDQPASHYGLRLALGSARVRLVDLAAAYGFLVKGGKVAPPTAVLGARAREHRLVSPETAYLVMDMLADAQPRDARFGENPLQLPFRVAAKTGTARGFADTVAVAVTNEFTVAAWTGRVDGEPTDGMRAMDAAAPLVRAALLQAARGQPLTLPTRPPGVESDTVCALSGLRPHAHCPHQKLELFVTGRAPSRSCDWHGAGGVDYPAIAAGWARRVAARGGLALAAH